VRRNMSNYPHTVIVRLTKEQYNKVKDDKSNIIRTLIDKYEDT
jgi:hypothetical protein